MNKGRFIKNDPRLLGNTTGFKKGSIPWNKGVSVYLGGKRFEKGQKPWNTGTKGLMKIWNKGKKWSDETKKKMSEARLGKSPWNKGLKGVQVVWNKGKKLPEYSGEGHWNWQGGKTPEIRRIRNSLENKLWRAEVFARDKYECQICGVTGKLLAANHIKKFSDFPELRFELTNGITLCDECHVKRVTRQELEWESYFDFNLMVRQYE